MFLLLNLLHTVYGVKTILRESSVHVWPPESSILSLYRAEPEVQHLPILEGGSRVLAAAHSDHDDGEEEEEAGHGEAHAVHRLVAHDDVTVHLVV